MLADQRGAVLDDLVREQALAGTHVLDPDRYLRAHGQGRRVDGEGDHGSMAEHRPAEEVCPGRGAEVVGRVRRPAELAAEPDDGGPADVGQGRLQQAWSFSSRMVSSTFPAEVVLTDQASRLTCTERFGPGPVASVGDRPAPTATAAAAPTDRPRRRRRVRACPVIIETGRSRCTSVRESLTSVRELRIAVSN